jgi:hypothetical protein
MVALNGLSLLAEIGLADPYLPSIPLPDYDRWGYEALTIKLVQTSLESGRY